MNDSNTIEFLLSESKKTGIYDDFYLALMGSEVFIPVSNKKILKLKNKNGDEVVPFFSSESLFNKGCLNLYLHKNIQFDNTSALNLFARNKKQIFIINPSLSLSKEFTTKEINSLICVFSLSWRKYFPTRSSSLMYEPKEMPLSFLEKIKNILSVCSLIKSVYYVRIDARENTSINTYELFGIDADAQNQNFWIEIKEKMARYFDDELLEKVLFVNLNADGVVPRRVRQGFLLYKKA